MLFIFGSGSRRLKDSNNITITPINQHRLNSIHKITTSVTNMKDLLKKTTLETIFSPTFVTKLTPALNNLVATFTTIGDKLEKALPKLPDNS